MAVKIKDIAESLGLSRNTFSKALNGNHVSKATRELVLKKAQELNYKSYNSEYLKSKKYRILLLSGKPFHNINFFVPIINSIENYCYINDYDFFEYTCNLKKTSFEEVANYIESLEVQGIVAIECFDHEFILKLLDLKIPVTFIDFPGYKFDFKPHLDLVVTSDQKLVCEYVKNLINKYDFSNFTYVGDFRHCLTFHERYMGMLRGIARSSQEHKHENDSIEKERDFDYGNVENLKNKIKALEKLPDCFFCCNDFVARKVVNALKELNYSVPKDTFVVGFDNVIEAINESPTITTFNVDKEFLGQEAIRVLVNRIERKKSPMRTIMIDCDLVERETTKK